MNDHQLHSHARRNKQFETPTKLQFLFVLSLHLLDLLDLLNHLLILLIQSTGHFHSLLHFLGLLGFVDGGEFVVQPLHNTVCGLLRNDLVVLQRLSSSEETDVGMSCDVEAELFITNQPANQRKRKRM